MNACAGQCVRVYVPTLCGLYDLRAVGGLTLSHRHIHCVRVPTSRD
jgi:hypothetical protein